jgi:glutamate-1-semialdehyde 2,1-aminomutase
MQNELSREFYSRALESLPGGVNSPVRAFGSVGGSPVFIKKASGCRLWDVDGNEYIDYVGSWGPMILGHAHPSVVSAVQKAADRGTSFGAPTEAETLLAEEVKKRVPAVDLVRFVNSGTEAAMSAVRLARGYTGREKIIKFAGCYHGHGDSFLVKAGSGAMTLGQPDSPGVPESLAALTLTARFNDISSVEALLEKHSGDIAAVLVEPVAGNMGVIPPGKDFLQNLRQLTLDHQIVLIFDEVMTGFRVSPGGAQTLYQVYPDLSVFGKVIGGGLPVGAFGGRREMMERVAPLGPVYQAGTLSGNPLAMASGLETLKHLDSRVYEHLEKMGLLLEIKLNEIIDRKGYPLCVNRVGSMFCLFFQPGPVKNDEDARQADPEEFAQFFWAMLERGIYLPPSQFESWFISLAHGQDEIERTVEKVQQSLKEVFP